MGKLIRLLCLPLVLVLCSCSDELGKKEEVKPQVTAFSRESVTSEVVATSEPNKYKVVLKWNPTSEPLMVTRSGAEQVKLNSATTEIADILDGGKTYEYKFETFKEGKSQAVQLLNLNVAVPVDYVFKGEKKLTGDLILAANRIFIQSGTVVVATRFKIQLKAKELISNGGLIQTYKHGQQDCPTRSDGYNGGDISITADSARGPLSISMVGARGCLDAGTGGKGGKLIIKVKNGESLVLNLDLGTSLGAPPRNSESMTGKLGEQATACVSLSGEDSCN